MSIKRVYIYSDNWWYSMSKEAFIKLAKQGKEHGFDDGIELEKYGARHINKPSSMQQYDEHEDYYTNNPQHYVINGVIDFKEHDWESHLFMIGPYETEKSKGAK